jgi:3-oxoacyl-[acyl-carrier protein] reductase
MFKPLQGRTVIVTGARRGIGRGIAKRFGTPGLYVLMVSRNLDEAETAAAEVGANASAFAADVTDPVSCWSRGVAPRYPAAWQDRAWAAWRCRSGKAARRAGKTTD